MPPGLLVMYDVSEGGVDCDSRTEADLTGLAEVAPEDPEPEFVDIIGLGETVVTLQENNHSEPTNTIGVPPKVATSIDSGSTPLASDRPSG